MGDYGRPIEFGLSLVPDAAEVAEARELAVRADGLGLDLIGIQDHPYQWRFLETWTLMADLLARTRRLRVFPDVANLPLRMPAMIAKQAASLDVLSDGRFELGLGAGSFWEAIGAMGGPVRSPRESLEAHEEAIQIIRLFLERGTDDLLRGSALLGVGAPSRSSACPPDRDLAGRLQTACARAHRPPGRRLGPIIPPRPAGAGH